MTIKVVEMSCRSAQLSCPPMAGFLRFFYQTLGFHVTTRIDIHIVPRLRINRSIASLIIDLENADIMHLVLNSNVSDFVFFGKRFFQPTMKRFTLWMWGNSMGPFMSSKMTNASWSDGNKNSAATSQVQVTRRDAICCLEISRLLFSSVGGNPIVKMAKPSVSKPMGFLFDFSHHQEQWASDVDSWLKIYFRGFLRQPRNRDSIKHWST